MPTPENISNSLLYVDEVLNYLSFHSEIQNSSHLTNLISWNNMKFMHFLLLLWHRKLWVCSELSKTKLSYEFIIKEFNTADQFQWKINTMVFFRPRFCNKMFCVLFFRKETKKYILIIHRHLELGDEGMQITNYRWPWQFIMPLWRNNNFLIILRLISLSFRSRNRIISSV